LAFGGAGPLHAVALAEELGLARVVVPTGPGVLSACGMLQASIRHDFVRAFFRALDALDGPELERAAGELLAEGEAAIAREGTNGNAVRCDLSVDLRYRGQEYTLNVPLNGGGTAELARTFHEAHEARYGHANRGERIEVVNLRVAAFAVAEPLPVTALAE